MSLLNRAREFFSGPNKNASRERRKLKRMACHQEFLGTREGSTFPLTVIDVGFGGFKVMSEHALGKRGDLLHMRRVATDFQRHLSGVYTTGIMARVAWCKERGNHYEAGLYLPEAPGAMRVSWFKELLKEMGFDEKTVFSQRNSRRHLCRLPAELKLVAPPTLGGLLLDLSPGGALFAAERAAGMGELADLSVRWGSQTLTVEASVVGVRANGTESNTPRWHHSLRFADDINKQQEKVLYGWLQELADHE